MSGVEGVLRIEPGQLRAHGPLCRDRLLPALGPDAGAVHRHGPGRRLTVGDPGPAGLVVGAVGGASGAPGPAVRPGAPGFRDAEAARRAGAVGADDRFRL